MSMLCVLPFFTGDKPLAILLSNWLKDLGGVKHHDCLLVIDPDCDEKGVIEPCREAFNNVYKCNSERYVPDDPNEKWGNGTSNASAPNEMFIAASTVIEVKYKRPFFWLEADAVPMRPSWLDEIEQEYFAGKKPFMGAFVNIPGIEPHMSGIGVYPAVVANHSIAMRLPGKIAWDYAGRQDTVGTSAKPPKAHFTNLIQHIYRTPTDPKGYSFSGPKELSRISPEAAVFHRCKDDSLIKLLRQQMGKKSKGEPVDPVIELKQQNEELRAELAALRETVKALTPQGDAVADVVAAEKPKMTQSERMKAIWAKRKAAKLTTA